MKYTTEELTPCKKKVNISVEPDEVNAAINTAVKLQQRGIAMDGFRKAMSPRISLRSASRASFIMTPARISLTFISTQCSVNLR